MVPGWCDKGLRLVWSQSIKVESSEVKIRGYGFATHSHWKTEEPAQQLLCRVKGSKVGRLGMGQLFKRSPVSGQISSGEAMDRWETEREAKFTALGKMGSVTKIGGGGTDSFTKSVVKLG